MNEDDTTTTEPAPDAPPTKRARTTWPIRICREQDGALHPLGDSPEFAEAREAEAWILAHGKPGERYRPARIGPPRKLVVRLEEA